MRNLLIIISCLVVLGSCQKDGLYGVWTQINSSNCLPDNRISGLATDNYGDMWVCVLQSPIVGYYNATVTSGGVTYNQTIPIHLFYNTLYRFNNFGLTQTIDTIILPQLKARVSNIGFDYNNKLHIGTEDGLLVNDGYYTWNLFSENNSVNNEYRSFKFNSEGLWYLDPHDAYHFDGIGVETFDAAAIGFTGEKIVDIMTKGNRFWVTSENQLFEKISGQFEEVLTGIWPYQPFVDEQENIWFLNDINQSQHPNKFELTKFDGTSLESFPIPRFSESGSGPKFQDLTVDTQDRVWISSSNEGIFMFNGQDWLNLTTSNSEIASNNIRTIKSDLDGNIWCVSSEDGISVLKSTWFY